MGLTLPFKQSALSSREQTWDVNVFWVAYFSSTAPFPKTRAHLETDTTPKRGADESVAKYQLVYFTSLFQLVYDLIISNQEPFPSLFFPVVYLCYKK